MMRCNDKVQDGQTLPYFNKPDFTPLFLSGDSEIQSQVDHVIAEIHCTDQHNQKITLDDLRGKIHVANFIFTKCGSVCPILTKHMKLIQERFSADTNLVMMSYSVTPWIDSVPRLKSYAELNGIYSPRWHLLTGDKAEIYHLARTSYFAEENIGYSRDSTAFLHTEHILLVDRSGRLRGIYNGTLLLDIEQLIKDIELLLNE